MLLRAVDRIFLKMGDVYDFIDHPGGLFADDSFYSIPQLEDVIE